MNNISNYLDEIEKSVMGELKDFQKATVERIDYLYRNGQKRVLVSDEVGLGKTLVARGTIAKFAKLRKEKGDNLVKVVYICSNSAIAEQNLDKLRLVKEMEVENVNTSRLSMQHLNIFMEENNEKILNSYIQLIPLTPNTSFKITNTGGIVEERALMYIFLREMPELKSYLRELYHFLSLEVKDWKYYIQKFKKLVNKCDDESDGKYKSFMINEVAFQLKNNKYDNIALINSLKNYLKYIKINGFKRNEAIPYIIQLRLIFTNISLNKLEPDLIIMDEFQRFKELLSCEKNSYMDMLTKKFFNMKDVRILMLSATPYKMYSTLDEIAEDEIDAHYSEFFNVMNFLKVQNDERCEFKEIWKNYSIALKEFNRDADSFILVKTKAEDAMYKNICRTERISDKQISNMIDDSDKDCPLNIFKEDIESYINVQKLLDDTGLNISVPIDYVKSSPYLMSFMKKYKLKDKIENYFKNNINDIYKMNNETFWLNEEDIDNYKKISYNNARLNNLMEHIFKDNSEKLLWIPPSMPYYNLKGVFKNTDYLSKILIFSSWEMVPRMVSSLVSYEIERKTIGNLDTDSQNLRYFAKNRYPSARLRFDTTNNKPKNLSSFALIYPSIFLKNIYNPIDSLNKNLSLEDIEFQIKTSIKTELDNIPFDKSKPIDSRWYYLTPVLLDNIYYKKHVRDWFTDIKNLVDDEDSANEGLKKHIKVFFKTFNHVKKFNNLGKKPKDLLEVLCDITISSPAICIYRTYEMLFNQDKSLSEYYNKFSFKFAKAFMDFMNSPESIAILDLIYESNSKKTYWKNVLRYSKEGNLQAVLDEYIHLLSNGFYKNNSDKITIISSKLLDSIKLKTTSYEFDTFDCFKSRMLNENKPNKSFRTHFAVSFTKGKEDQSDTDRKKSVRDSFNSPFRPFVLVSTSIGQEGLDFHNYCRKIVHWNLPSNPIDIEQREGRINRFKNLAIRQNIAKRYGKCKFKNNIWEELFLYALEHEKNRCSSDLIPFWGLKNCEDMIKIERIIPLYPFSRDISKYGRLIEILTLYRITLGQSNQEDLLKYLIKILGDNCDEEMIKKLFINLSPYYKNSC